MAQQTYGQAGRNTLKSAFTLLSPFATDNPAAAGVRGGMAAGQAMSGAAVGTNPMAQAGNAALKAILSPYQKGVEKALKRSGEAHADEAIQSGVPPTHIEAEAGLAPQQGAPQLSNQQMTNSPMGQAQAQMGYNAGVQPQAEPQMMNPFASMRDNMGLLAGNAGQNAPFQGASYDPNGNVRDAGFLGDIFGKNSYQLLKQQEMALNNAAGAQKVAGMVPLQASDKLTAASQYATNQLSRSGKAMEAEKGVINEYNEQSKDYKIRTGEFNIALGLLGEDFDLENTNPADFAKRVKNMSSSDQFALVYSFVKMSDPNAVKEGEFKAVESGAMSKAEAMKLWGGRLGIGDLNRMTDSAVTKLYQTSRKRYAADTKAQNNIRAKSASQLKRYREQLGMPVDENVLTDYSLAGIRKGRGQQQGQLVMHSSGVPVRSSAPAGAKGWDSDNQKWVF